MHLNKCNRMIVINVKEKRALTEYINCVFLFYFITSTAQLAANMKLLAESGNYSNIYPMIQIIKSKIKNESSYKISI
jgi:hypothetical protein